jgi:superfamily II DNA/RNA helicase
MSFNSFNLHPQIAGVKALGYQDTNPIQRQAIPPVLQKRRYGPGPDRNRQTAAFVLPDLLSA